MTQDVIPFTYKNTTLQAFSKDGEAWFVAKDVAQVLDYSSTQAMTRSLDDDEKGMQIVHTLGGDQNVTIISEAGLYSATLRSRVPEAKKFKRWVTHEVLPPIRKHGAYATPATVEKLLADPDTAIQLLETIKAERAERARLELEAEANAPKVLFADSVATSNTTILVGELAKILRGNGIDIGQNRLFAWLRENGYLIRRKGSDWNMPTQYAMDIGLFEIKETAITHPDGHITVNKTPKVTGKGQAFFVNKFLGKDAA